MGWKTRFLILLVLFGVQSLGCIWLMHELGLAEDRIIRLHRRLHRIAEERMRRAG